MSNIIDKYKTIFIHIPKNGGTSILKALGQERATHEKWFFFKKEYPEKWGEYLKFAVIRNPWDRLVSNYKYTKLKQSYWHSVDGNSVYGKHKDYDLLEDKTFEETVLLLNKNFKLFKHQGWANQYSYICNKKQIPQVKVLKFENLNNDFKSLFPNLILPNLNKSRDDNDYRQYYNANTKQIVAQIYKKDIKLFNYQF